MTITFDFVLNPVLAAFKVTDISQLPKAVQDKYNEVVNNLQNIPGMSTDDLAAALGPALLNGGLSILKGNPAGAAQMMYSSMMGIMATAGGPIGGALAAGLDALPAILSAIGGTAQGGTGQNEYNSTPNGEIWYGSWNLAKKDNPVDSTDPRWVPWTNTKSKTPISIIYSDGKYDICGDDLAIVDTPYPKPFLTSKQNLQGFTYDAPTLSNVNDPYPASPGLFGLPDPNYHNSSNVNGGSKGWNVSGQFAWLPDALKDYPVDSFDYAIAQHICGLLEQYYNAQGPPIIPPEYFDPSINPIGSFQNPGYVPGNSMSLRDMVEGMLIGWNATHLPGTPIQINGIDRLIQMPDTTFGGKTQSGGKGFPSSLLHQRKRVGDIAAFCVLGDPRDQDKKLMLNTGPLLPGIVELYSMAPTAPSSQTILKALAPTNTITPAHVTSRPKIVLKQVGKTVTAPTVAAKAVTKNKIIQSSVAATGATVGFMVGGPVGGVVGGIIGWLIG